MVISALLGGLGGTAVAQGERTDGSAMVTGSVRSVAADWSDIDFSDTGGDDGDWVGHGRGVKSLVGFEWSDPRLPSKAEMVWNFGAYDPVGVAVSNMWLLEGPDGYWTGPWIGWADPEEHWHGTVVLTGHGIYEGLYAILTEGPREDEAGTVTQVFEGAILSGEMPPMPDPLEPAAE
jgi:hypothetical protein